MSRVIFGLVLIAFGFGIIAAAVIVNVRAARRAQKRRQRCHRPLKTWQDYEAPRP